MADFRAGAVVAADGTATILLTVSATRVLYRVTQVSTMADAVGDAASCALYRDGMRITPMVAQGDAAGGDPPIDVRPGQRMTVEWLAGTPGAVVDALFIYDEIEFGRGAR